MKTKNKKNSRPIDETAKRNYDWMTEKLAQMKKTNVKSWKALAIIAFIGGMFAAIILTVSSNWQQVSDAAGKPAKNDRIAPSVPTGLAITPIAANPSAVNLKWNASTDNPGGSGIKGYKIYRNGQYLKLIAVPSVSTSDGNLNCGTNYGYAVSAIDNAGNESAKSPAVSYMAPTCPNPGPPAPPTNVSAFTQSCSRVSIQWTASTSQNLSYYYVYRNGMKIASVPATSSSYPDSSVSPSTSYSYNVYAVDIYGNPSVASNAASATTPPCTYSNSTGF